MTRYLIPIFICFSFFLVAPAESETHADRIEGPFSSPQEVTETCLMCHEDAAAEVMKSSHWTWLSPEEMKVPGHKTPQRIGKKNLFNNFCINLNSNWPRCTSCHIGYGWKG